MDTNTDVNASNCVCYWIIEEPSGSKSVGRCKKCGKTKEFFNYTDTSVWSSEYNYDNLSE